MARTPAAACERFGTSSPSRARSYSPRRDQHPARGLEPRYGNNRNYGESSPSRCRSPGRYRHVADAAPVGRAEYLYGDKLRLQSPEQLAELESNAQSRFVTRQVEQRLNQTQAKWCAAEQAIAKLLGGCPAADICHATTLLCEAMESTIETRQLFETRPAFERQRYALEKQVLHTQAMVRKQLRAEVCRAGGRSPSPRKHLRLCLAEAEAAGLRDEDLADARGLCERATVPCSFADLGCTAVMHLVDMSQHRNECKFRPVKCRGFLYGCRDVMPFWELEEHEQQCELAQLVERPEVGGSSSTVLSATEATPLPLSDTAIVIPESLDVVDHERGNSYSSRGERRDESRGHSRRSSLSSQSQYSDSQERRRRHSRDREGSRDSQDKSQYSDSQERRRRHSRDREGSRDSQDTVEHDWRDIVGHSAEAELRRERERELERERMLEEERKKSVLIQREREEEEERFLQEEMERLRQVHQHDTLKHKVCQHLIAASYVMGGIDLRKTFSLADKDRTGTISSDEFLTICKMKLKLKGKDEELLHFFSLICAHKSGTIDIDEFIKIVTKDEEDTRGDHPSRAMQEERNQHAEADGHSKHATSGHVTESDARGLNRKHKSMLMPSRESDPTRRSSPSRAKTMDLRADASPRKDEGKKERKSLFIVSDDVKAVRSRKSLFGGHEHDASPERSGRPSKLEERKAEQEEDAAARLSLT